MFRLLPKVHSAPGALGSYRGPPVCLAEAFFHSLAKHPRMQPESLLTSPSRISTVFTTMFLLRWPSDMDLVSKLVSTGVGRRGLLWALGILGILSSTQLPHHTPKSPAQEPIQPGKESLSSSKRAGRLPSPHGAGHIPLQSSVQLFLTWLHLNPSLPFWQPSNCIREEAHGL